MADPKKPAIRLTADHCKGVLCNHLGIRQKWEVLSAAQALKTVSFTPTSWFAELPQEHHKEAAALEAAAKVAFPGTFVLDVLP